jgi:hypothetical protein
MRKAMVFMAGLACMALFAANLWLALAFWRALDANKTDAVAVPRAVSSASDFSIIALRRENFSDEDLEDLLKKLIREYITARYTVTGSAYMDARNLGVLEQSQIWNITLGPILKIPASRSRSAAARSNFAGLMSEVGEIAGLKSAKTTRMVKITGGPRRYLDHWVTDVEFVLKTPLAWDISKAEREKYEIRMYVEPISGISEIKTDLPVSSVFYFEISSVEKIRK